MLGMLCVLAAIAAIGTATTMMMGVQAQEDEGSTQGPAQGAVSQMEKVTVDENGNIDTSDSHYENAQRQGSHVVNQEGNDGNMGGVAKGDKEPKDESKDK